MRPKVTAGLLPLKVHAASNGRLTEGVDGITHQSLW